MKKLYMIIEKLDKKKRNQNGFKMDSKNPIECYYIFF